MDCRWPHSAVARNQSHPFPLEGAATPPHCLHRFNTGFQLTLRPNTCTLSTALSVPMMVSVECTMNLEMGSVTV